MFAESRTHGHINQHTCVPNNNKTRSNKHQNTTGRPQPMQLPPQQLPSPGQQQQQLQQPGQQQQPGLQQPGQQQQLNGAGAGAAQEISLRRVAVAAPPPPSSTTTSTTDGTSSSSSSSRGGGGYANRGAGSREQGQEVRRKQNMCCVSVCVFV